MGYELVPFVVPDPLEYVSVYTGVLTSDGSMRATIGGLEGESLLPGYNEVLWITSLPRAVRSLIANVLGMLGEGRKAHLLRSTGHRDAMQYWEMLIRLQNYRRLFVDRMRDQVSVCGLRHVVGFVFTSWLIHSFIHSLVCAFMICIGPSAFVCSLGV
jgi:hypothetical protein